MNYFHYRDCLTSFIFASNIITVAKTFIQDFYLRVFGQVNVVDGGRVEVDSVEAGCGAV
jgi:hypothetical protein